MLEPSDVAVLQKVKVQSNGLLHVGIIPEEGLHISHAVI
jgi:hypothetical protein